MTRVTLRPGPHLANTAKVIDARGARPRSRLVVPGAAAGDAQQPCQRVEVLLPRCRGRDLITSSTSGQLDRDTADRLRTVLGAAQRPRRTRRRSLMIEAAIETPTYDLTVFKLRFGRLTGKAYTKGERVLRFEAIAHNTAELRCGRMIEKFPEIVTRLAGVVERFATALDCVDTGFIRDAILDGAAHRRPAGCHPDRRVDLNKSRMRDAVRAARALALAPNGFTAAEFTVKGTPAPGTITSATASAWRPTARANCGANTSTSRPSPPLPRPAAGRTNHRRPAHPARPAHRPDPRRDPQPRMGHKPAHWARVDRDYERIRLDMQTLFNDLGIETRLAA